MIHESDNNKTKQENIRTYIRLFCEWLQPYYFKFTDGSIKFVCRILFTYPENPRRRKQRFNVLRSFFKNNIWESRYVKNGKIYPFRISKIFKRQETTFTPIEIFSSNSYYKFINTFSTRLNYAIQ